MINSGMSNYGGYLGLIGDIMSAKSAGGADELNVPTRFLFSKIPLISRNLLP
jgi:hypothetical protein